MSEKKTHSVKYNFIMNSILKMSSFIFPLITFPYVTRVLGAKGIGQVNFASAFVGYFSMAAMLGIPTYGIRVCAQCRDNREKLSRTVQELLIISSITTVIAYIVMAILVFEIPTLQGRTAIIYLSSTMILLTTIGMEWFYQAVEEYGYITYRNLAFKVLSVILMFLFIHQREDYILYAGVNVVGTVGSNILNFIRIRKYIICKPVRPYDFRRHLKPIMVFFMFSVATTIYTSLDTVMLGFMTNDVQTGYYAAATKMKNLLVSLVTALGTVLLPRASYYIENDMKEEFRRIIKKAFQFVIVSALPLTVFCMFEAKDTIGFLAGSGFLKATPAMIIITPTIFFIGLSNITGMQILIPLGLETCTVLSTVAGAIVDLILNVIFIPKIGAAGAALGTAVAEAVVLLVQILQMKMKNKLHYVKVNWKDAGKVVLALIFASAGLIAIKMLVGAHGYFLNLLISACIFFGIYGILLLITKEELIVQIFEQFKERSPL